MLRSQVDRHNAQNSGRKALDECCCMTWPWFLIVLSIALAGIGFGGYLSVKQQLDRIKSLGPLSCTYSGAYYTIVRDYDCFKARYYTSWNVSLPLLLRLSPGADAEARANSNVNVNAFATTNNIVVATSPLVLEVKCIGIVNQVYNATDTLDALGRQWANNHVCWLDPDDMRVILFDLRDMEKTVRHWGIAMWFFFACWIVTVCWACLSIAKSPRFTLWACCGGVLTSHPFKRRDTSSATAVTLALPITHTLVNPHHVKALVSTLVFHDFHSGSTNFVGGGGVSDSLTTLILLYADVYQELVPSSEDGDCKDEEDDKWSEEPSLACVSETYRNSDHATRMMDRLRSSTWPTGLEKREEEPDVWVSFLEPNGDWVERRIKECRFDKTTKDLTHILIAAPTWPGVPYSIDTIWVPTSSIYLSAVIHSPAASQPDSSHSSQRQ